MKGIKKHRTIHNFMLLPWFRKRLNITSVPAEHNCRTVLRILRPYLRIPFSVLFIALFSALRDQHLLPVPGG